jgi:putative tRNA adenosine deaminase-associated protein
MAGVAPSGRWCGRQITTRHRQPATRHHRAGESDTIPSQQASPPETSAAVSGWDYALIGVTMTEVTSADFAVVVYREEDAWEAEVLPPALGENLDDLILALRQQPSLGGTIGLAVVGDDFFVALRIIGSQESVFLSDVTAAPYWPLARQVLDYLDVPVPDDDDDIDQVLPAGDLSIFADLGIDEMELGAISGDLDMYPSEAVQSIGRRLGFSRPLQRALEGVLGPEPGRA